MFYGLWRYWRKAKKELLILGGAFGLLFACITLLATTALSGAFSKGNQHIFAVGVQNSGGSLSRISPYVSEALDSISGVQSRLVWTGNNNQVEILGQERELEIVFTNSQYLSMLKPKFLNGPQRYRCDPKCTLVGAAVASKYGQPESIKVGDQHYEVTAIFDQQSFEFPDGGRPDIILDVAQFGLASSMSQILKLLSNNSPDITIAQVADLFPIYLTLIEVSPSYDRELLTNQIKAAYDDQKHLFSNIKRMISLRGSDDQTLGLIQGPFFDQKTKDNMLLMQMLFLVAAGQLFLVTLVNLISVITRFNLMRSYENNCRYALGGHKWSLFLNNIYFIQPIMLVALFSGAAFIWLLYSMSAYAITTYLKISLPAMTSLYIVFGGLMLVVALGLPALINSVVLVRGLRTEKALLTRKTILQMRGLNTVLFLLATLSIFLAISTYSHWQALKQRGTENIVATTKMVHVSHFGKSFVSPKWESVLRELEQKVPNIGFLSTLPGDRNLDFMSFQLNNEQCQVPFGGWVNTFSGQPFALMTGQELDTESWAVNDIAVSKSVLAVCGFDADEIIGKYLQDGKNNHYQIRAVVQDIPYDLHLATPQIVIYQRETSLSNFLSMVLPEYVDLDELSADLEQNFLEYNMQMEIKEQGSLVAFIASKLMRETTTMIICFVLMGLSLSVLFLAFTQHTAKVLLMRNREWGTQRAMGANKQQLSRSLLIELVQEWGLALVFAILFAVLYAQMQQHLLSASAAVTFISVWIAAFAVLAGAAYYAVTQLHKQCRLTPANLLRSES